MKTNFIGSVALCAVATWYSAAAIAEPVKIGLITTLSGGGAGLGVEIRDGFMLAMQNAGDVDVEVLIRDDQQKPNVAVQLADEMLLSEKVDIMTGIIWSNLALAVVPNAVNSGVFYVSPNAGPSLLAGKGCHENYFNVSWQNDTLHEAAGEYAKNAGYKKPFLMAPNYPAGQDALIGFKRAYQGEVAQEIFTKLGQTDYAAEIGQMRAAGADSAYLFLPGGMGISFLKQYAQSGVDLPLIGPGATVDQTILNAVGAAAVGVRNSSQWNKDIDTPANVEFVAAFQAEYGRLPSLFASQGYDAANLILSALKTSTPDDADAFREALRAADFSSVRGNFKFGANQHPIQDFYIREVVKEGDIYTNKIVEKVLVDHGDVYVSECTM